MVLYCGGGGADTAEDLCPIKRVSEWRWEGGFIKRRRLKLTEAITEIPGMDGGEFKWKYDSSCGHFSRLANSIHLILAVVADDGTTVLLGKRANPCRLPDVPSKKFFFSSRPKDSVDKERWKIARHCFFLCRIHLSLTLCWYNVPCAMCWYYSASIHHHLPFGIRFIYPLFKFLHFYNNGWIKEEGDLEQGWQWDKDVW